MAKRKEKKVTPKQIVHISLIFILFAGSLFAWYQSFKETGFICQKAATCSTQVIAGMPVCVIGALFFTIALLLAAYLWFVE